MPVHHAIKPLISSPDYSALDFRCSPDQPASSTEWAESIEIAIPRRGIYARQSCFGKDVADSTTALFFNQGQDYEIGHPAGGGDETTVFLVETESVFQYVSQEIRIGSLGSERLFALGSVRITPGEQALHHFFYRASLEPERMDAFHIQEVGAFLLARLIKRAFPNSADRRKPGSAESVANLARLWTAAHYTEPISLLEIANGVGYSQFHLARCFKAATGLSLHRYLTQLRLLESLNRLLDERQQGIAAVAHDLGFSSHSHFSTAFQRTFGMTPSAFRRSPSSRRITQMRKILQDERPLFR